MAVATSTMLTIAGLGMTAMSAASSMSAANKEAEAAVQEGNILAANKAKETRLKAAKLQSSFLNSGLTLEGTPMAVIDDTFNTGIADINQISSNANNRASAAIENGRSKALGQLASGFSGMDWGGVGSSVNSVVTTAGSYLPDSFAYGLNEAGYGNMAYDMLEKSDIRNGYY